MARQIASKAKDLVLELNRLRFEDAIPEFTFRRLRREAEALKEADRSDAFEALGMIAALEKDIKGVRQEFGKALAYSGYAEKALLNYATSLSFLGFLTESVKIRGKLHDSFRSHTGFLMDFLFDNYVTGRFHKARDLIAELKKIQPEEILPYEGMIVSCSRFISVRDISERRMEEMTEHVEDFLHERNILHKGVFFEVQTDEESSFLAGMVPLPLGVDEIVDLNFEFAEGYRDLAPPKRLNFLFEVMEKSSDGDRPERAVQTC